MAKGGGRHLTKENREVIEDGIREHASATKIAKRLGVSTSTVTREVKNHRTVHYGKPPKNQKPALKCIHYSECTRHGDACGNCLSAFTCCKSCKSRDCTKNCSEFEHKLCPITEQWPYVCREGCKTRAYCGYPKYHYDAGDAYESYRESLSESRVGICITQDELNRMNNLIVPLIKQGQSLEAIWATHEAELPITVRSAYNYLEKGVLGFAAIDMPRKVRILPKHENSSTTRTRIDRTRRTFDDFKALPLEEQVRVVQGDSVEGYNWNTHDILTLDLVAFKFQFHLYKIHADSDAVVKWLDIIETSLGSPEAFSAIFGTLLLDRGCEFDDWAGMERSCLVNGAKRCRVYYCDPMTPSQKPHAERTHERLRRILPKGRSDFDKLNVWDVAVCSSHVNSYPIPSLAGKCPYEAAAGVIPVTLLDELGIERIPPDEVMLKPLLMAHAVKL